MPSKLTANYVYASSTAILKFSFRFRVFLSVYTTTAEHLEQTTVCDLPSIVLYIVLWTKC